MQELVPLVCGAAIIVCSVWGLLLATGASQGRPDEETQFQLDRPPNEAQSQPVAAKFESVRRRSPSPAVTYASVARQAPPTRTQTTAARPAQSRSVAQLQKRKVKEYEVSVKGYGRFNSAEGQRWTSYNATVSFTVDIAFLTDAVERVAVRKIFGQLPKSADDPAEYVLPTFQEEEMQRMQEQAAEMALERHTNGQFRRTVTDGERYEGPPHESALCQRCQELGFSCNRVIEDVDGVRTKWKWGTLKSRRERLDEHGVATLYHQTSAESASRIVQDQLMKRGMSGALGGGIYFALSPEDTQRKAKQHGVILVCEVLLGATKTLRVPAPSVCFADLLKQGYDSVRCDAFQSGPEFVVYNWDQVLSIRILPKTKRSRQRRA